MLMLNMTTMCVMATMLLAVKWMNDNQPMD